MLDLSAAFDTVNYSTLLLRLERRLGVVTPPIRGSHHICQAEHKTFHVNGTSSDQLPVSCSVPQGSSAGPVEFIAYTGVQPSRSPAPSVQYADDKQAYVDTPVSDVPTARATLQSCSTDVGDWCYSRRLQLNETKTELIWFGSKKILGKVPKRAEPDSRLQHRPVSEVGSQSWHPTGH